MNNTAHCPFCSKPFPYSDYCHNHDQCYLYINVCLNSIRWFVISNSTKSCVCIDYIKNSTTFYNEVKPIVELPFILNINPDNYKTIEDRLLSQKAFI